MLSLSLNRAAGVCPSTPWVSEGPHCAGKPGSPRATQHAACKPMDASVQTGCEQLHIPCRRGPVMCRPSGLQLSQDRLPRTAPQQRHPIPDAFPNMKINCYRRNLSFFFFSSSLKHKNYEGSVFGGKVHPQSQSSPRIWCQVDTAAGFMQKRVRLQCPKAGIYAVPPWHVGTAQGDGCLTSDHVFPSILIFTSRSQLRVSPRLKGTSPSVPPGSPKGLGKTASTSGPSLHPSASSVTFLLLLDSPLRPGKSCIRCGHLIIIITR